MSNLDEPPHKKSKNLVPSPSSFCSLPEELIYMILARVPKRHRTIVSCVSKKLANLVRSPEFQEWRCRLGLDSLFLCFNDEVKLPFPRRWFNTLLKNKPISMDSDSPNPFDFDDGSVIAVGPEIFFFRGLSSLFIFDSRSGKSRRGPDMKMKSYSTLGFVGEKIYVIGGIGLDGDEAESFDIKKQIWEVAPVPEDRHSGTWRNCVATVSLDKKVYALGSNDLLNCYDTSNGSCEKLKLAKSFWWKTGVCVIENVLYVYYERFGLMWFETKTKSWKVVHGLSHLEEVRSVGMAEYYGKMAFLWVQNVGTEEKEIRYRLIGLVKREGEIHGSFEERQPQLLTTVPRSCSLLYCLSVST